MEINKTNIIKTVVLLYPLLYNKDIRKIIHGRPNKMSEQIKDYEGKITLEQLLTEQTGNDYYCNNQQLNEFIHKPIGVTGYDESRKQTWIYFQGSDKVNCKITKVSDASAKKYGKQYKLAF
jgi:hypothetical protein